MNKHQILLLNDLEVHFFKESMFQKLNIDKNMADFDKNIRLTILISSENYLLFI